MKRILWIIVAIKTSFILVLAALFLIPQHGKEENLIHSTRGSIATDTTIHIYVAEYLYHTGLILPVTTNIHDWRREFSCLEGSHYAEFGWGDSVFFMAGNVNAKMAIRALFASKASVVGVIGLNAPPFHTEPSRFTRIPLNAGNYSILVQTLQSMIVQHPNGNGVYLREGFWGKRSGFYQANMLCTGQYSAIKNCNVWSATCLRSAGITTPLWSGLPQPLQWMLHRNYAE